MSTTVVLTMSKLVALLFTVDSLRIKSQVMLGTLFHTACSIFELNRSNFTLFFKTNI